MNSKFQGQRKWILSPIYTSMQHVRFEWSMLIKVTGREATLLLVARLTSNWDALFFRSGVKWVELVMITKISVLHGWGRRRRSEWSNRRRGWGRGKKWDVFETPDRKKASERTVEEEELKSGCPWVDIARVLPRRHPPTHTKWKQDERRVTTRPSGSSGRIVVNYYSNLSQWQMSSLESRVVEWNLYPLLFEW